MTLRLDPLHPMFAAEASGVDLRRPVPPDVVREIEAAMDRYAVLVFRGQPMTEDEQVAFASHFGEQSAGFGRIAKGTGRLKQEVLADISNLGPDGRVAHRQDRRLIGAIANQLWHSDSSFQDPPARYSMLNAVEIPAKGGDTEFCDLRVAWETLDEETRAEIEAYSVEHYALHSRSVLGDTDYDEDQRKVMPPVVWPLVRTHAGSGRKLVFIGAHAVRIPELTLAEGRMLLQDLLEHAVRREAVYVHQWRAGDLVMWDNRCTLHRGRRFDLGQRRELRRATTMEAHPQALSS